MALERPGERPENTALGKPLPTPALPVPCGLCHAREEQTVQHVANTPVHELAGPYHALCSQTPVASCRESRFLFQEEMRRRELGKGTQAVRGHSLNRHLLKPYYVPALRKADATWLCRRHSLKRPSRDHVRALDGG